MNEDQKVMVIDRCMDSMNMSEIRRNMDATIKLKKLIKDKIHKKIKLSNGIKNADE